MKQTLQNILEGCALTLVEGNLEQPISQITADSRQVSPNSLFVAIAGTQSDGHDYIDAAIEKGAKAIICETLPPETNSEVTYLLSPNSARTLGQVAANFYGNPSRQMKVVAITGTNGKTSVATLLFRLFRRLGYNVGLLSTVQNQINEEIIPTRLTTPDAITIQSLLKTMQQKGCTHCFMEASSHAIHQERIAGLELAGAVFTNISHDHLDYHGTFDNYIKAKKKLFDDLPKSAFALVNTDDKRGLVMLQNTASRQQKTFALQRPADYKGKIIENTLEGLQLLVNGQEAWFRLIGNFNAYNLMATYAVAELLGENSADILTELSAIEPPAGRFERIIAPERGINGVVDYAHTPDALQNVLKTLQQVNQEQGQIITVVGCGGDRDKAKRPIMAKIACQFSHKVILTSDNPRNEDPEQILEDMQNGVSIVHRRKVETIVLREEAIKRACEIAQAGDIVLVAGKGHETYQEIAGKRYDFDDRLMLSKYLG